MAYGVADPPPRGDRCEQHNHVAADPGPSQQPGALAGPGGRLPELGLGQLHLLPHERAEILSDVREQLADGRTRIRWCHSRAGRAAHRVSWRTAWSTGTRGLCSPYTGPLSGPSSSPGVGRALAGAGRTLVSAPVAVDADG